MGRRPSADPFEEIDPDAHHAKGEKVEHEDCYPRLVLPPEEGEAYDHEETHKDAGIRAARWGSRS